MPLSWSIRRSSVACTRSSTYVGDTTASSRGQHTPSGSRLGKGAGDEVRIVPGAKERGGADVQRGREDLQNARLHPRLAPPVLVERRRRIALHIRAMQHSLPAVEHLVRREGDEAHAMTGAGGGED